MYMLLILCVYHIGLLFVPTTPVFKSAALLFVSYEHCRRACVVLDCGMPAHIGCQAVIVACIPSQQFSQLPETPPLQAVVASQTMPAP